MSDKIKHLKADIRSLCKDRGVCVLCQSREAAPGKNICLKCFEDRRKHKEAQVKRLKAAGLCRLCGKPAVNAYYCAHHRDHINQYAKQRRQKLKAINLK